MATILSFLGSAGCMLGLIFAIPRFVNGPAPRKALLAMWLWGGGAVACTVIFCLALMRLLRARRGLEE